MWSTVRDPNLSPTMRCDDFERISWIPPYSMTRLLPFPLFSYQLRRRRKKRLAPLRPTVSYANRSDHLPPARNVKTARNRYHEQHFSNRDLGVSVSSSRRPHVQQTGENVGLANTSSDIDEKGLLIRTFRIYQTKQVVVSFALQARVLFISHDPLLAVQPGGTKMYETLRRQYYWRNIASDVYHTAQDFLSCAAQRSTMYKEKNHYGYYILPDP